jgi:radical SAM-linked protein
MLSLLEGIVSRGDERAGRLVLDAYRRGARLDAWEEHVRLDIWRQVIQEAGWDVLGETCRARGETEALPWAGISLGLSRSVVADAADAARAAEPPAVQAGEAAPSPWRRLVFSFTKSGPAAFLAHLDLMTVFERALARTGWRIRFTEGYNPKPRLEFASPLSLGLESREEVAGIDLFDMDSGREGEFMTRMNGALPVGMVVMRAQVVADAGAARRRSLMSLYWGADFEITDQTGETRTMRLPATGPSIRKTLESEGTWMTSMARRTATWAADSRGAPVSYFDALDRPSTPPLS